MVVSPSTLLVMFLVVCAASLASYLLSQWAFIRSSTRTAAWVGVSLGTTLLLAAAVIGVILISSLSLHPLSEGESLSAEMIRPAQFDGPITQLEPAGEEAQVQSSQSAISAAGQADPVYHGTPAGNAGDGSPRHRNELETLRAVTSLRSDAQIRARATDAVAAPGVAGVPAAVDPWAATSCVRSFHPDPADLTRWTMENGCGKPVAIVLAACALSPPECNDRQSTSWKYRAGGMVLPARAQRTTTDAEETQYGRQIRYVACIVTTPLAIRLIGLGSGTQSSPPWLEQFEAAREQDECLARVQRWSDVGSHSGILIDLLLSERPVP